MPKAGTRSAQGSGTIRKKSITRSGRSYTYWESRVTVGRDPGTGRQIQRSFTGKTQAEVREKLQAAAVSVNDGTYTDPCNFTVGQWLDIWMEDYLIGVKPNTLNTYDSLLRNHIKPAMAAVKLNKLQPHTIQRFINQLDLSPASVRLAYSILNQALGKALQLDYIPKNPAAVCEQPRKKQEEISPLDNQQTAALLKAAKGTRIERLLIVALLTGCRESELLGLTWDCVDFDRGNLNICKQLNKKKQREQGEFFSSPKSGKGRIITPASSVLSTLMEEKRFQAEQRLKAGPSWSNPNGLVFTNAAGGPVDQQQVIHWFRSVLKKAGLGGFRFHDIRHTYAVNALRAGDDFKTLQGNMGHANAGFTLDRYGHFTDDMKRASAQRMEGFMKNVLNG